MKVIHIIGEAPLHTNCFLLIGEQNHAVAIDPAADAQKFIEALEEEGASLTHILLTHGHPDHIGAVEQLREKYGAKVYMNEGDVRKYRPAPDVLFEDFGTIEVDDMCFQTIFTPGHTPGSTCIRCGDMLFSGDTLFAGDIGRTDLAGGDMDAMMQSLKKLKEAITEDLQVLPGHEEFSTMEREKKYNRYLRDL
ncbi:MBL fold metallo-hydrolase [Ruminococcaceae bacterium OttesenSCG-928-I18]|nr:MBL fold metallo-hydrolase [Ruminococcaceae bacterium OttesenSCG-928-I18]